MMNEHALVLIQNIESSGIEYQEVILNPPGLNAVVGINSATGELGYKSGGKGVVISATEIGLDITVAAKSLPAKADGVFIIDGVNVKQTTVGGILNDADKKVSADASSSGGHLDAVLNVSGALRS